MTASRRPACCLLAVQLRCRTLTGCASVVLQDQTGSLCWAQLCSSSRPWVSTATDSGCCGLHLCCPGAVLLQVPNSCGLDALKADASNSGCLVMISCHPAAA